MALACLAKDAWADGSEYVLSVPAGQTGTVSGWIQSTLLNHVHGAIVSTVYGDVANMSYYSGVGTGGGAASYLGVTSYVYGNPEDGWYWEVSGLPPGDYFITYGGGEPNFGYIEVEDVPSLFDQVNAWFDDLWITRDENNPNAQYWLGSFYQMMSTKSYAITYEGDLAGLISVNFGGWLD